jgi:[ribosomal protein S5]-alanine N-acetyltransferase
MLTIKTDQVLLRPFTRDDAPDVTRLAGDWEVAKTTALMPHPYPPGAAENWIATHAGQWDSGTEYTLAVCDAGSGDLVGAISLRVDEGHEGNIGYWIGRPYWGKGYASEAVRCLLALAFDHLQLPKVWAIHMATNVASGKVMAKNGMRHVGRLLKTHRDEIVPVYFEKYSLTRKRWTSLRGVSG